MTTRWAWSWERDLKVEHDLNSGMYNVMFCFSVFFFLVFVFGFWLKIMWDDEGEGNGVRRVKRKRGKDQGSEIGEGERRA